MQSSVSPKIPNIESLRQMKPSQLRTIAKEVNAEIPAGALEKSELVDCIVKATTKQQAASTNSKIAQPPAPQAKSYKIRLMEKSHEDLKDNLIKHKLWGDYYWSGMETKSKADFVDMILSEGHQEQALGVKVPGYIVSDKMLDALATFAKEFPEEPQGPFSSLV